MANNLLDIQDSFQALLIKGRILIIHKNYDEGLKCYKDSLDMESFDLVDYLDEIAYFSDPVLFKENKKMYEIAVSLCDFYLEREEDAYVLYFKGHALYRLSRFDESLNQFDYILNLEPNFEYAYSTKSEILFELKRYDEALDFVNKGLELFPECKLNYNKSKYLYYLESYEDALICINKYLEYEKDDEAIGLKSKIETKMKQLP